ncbi:MAG: YeeE/YedE family protein [Chloroflexi bacterium]|nr:YeeE/YedE family protein [Chloroflexota bacterium]
MLPIDLAASWGKPLAYLFYTLIGLGFGVSLETAGFSISTKLAGQFYFKDQTVFKTMFTAVLFAMPLIFIAVGLGWLDYDRIYVPPTYFWPGVVGGLLLGFAIIIGGFCPGTSIVSTGTGKLDGLLFVLGAMVGALLFGGTVDRFYDFSNSSYMGRFTLPDWLGLDTGVVVFILVIFGVVLIWGADAIERAWKKRENIFDPATADKEHKILVGVSLLLFILALITLIIGQPTQEDLWKRVAPEKQPLLDSRAVQIVPAELREAYYSPIMNLIMLDVRDEADYNLYHIQDARHVDIADLPSLIPELQNEPDGTVVVVMSNDETRATEAWKILVSKPGINAYILEGGINNWIKVYAPNAFDPIPNHADDTLAWQINQALGSNQPGATPTQQEGETEFEPKIKLQKKAPTGAGGCG